MPPTHYKFSTNGVEHNLCRKPGRERTDHCPHVTCGWCLKELSIRGWYKEFKVHFQKDDGEILCRGTTTRIAKRRKTLTKDIDKVTCKICRKLLGLGRAARSKSRWAIIGDDEVLFERRL